MGDVLGKLSKLIEQFLPFMETAPTWLRIWIYVLIGLNFVTASGLLIANISSKVNRADSESFKHFSIDAPKAQELIPLGDSGRWMIAGKFPAIAADKDTKHDIQLEVLKLPDRDKVPQDGSMRLSTVAGVWRFESAKFSGAGNYEVVATATLGSATDYRSVTVSCSDKSSAYRQSIINDRQQRGASPIDWQSAQRVTSDQVVAQLAGLQQQFYHDYIEQHDLNASLATVTQALNLAETALPADSNNWYIQGFRAYNLKNYAMIMRDEGHQDEANRSLDEAQKMFSAMHEQKPDDPSAWNGLGSIAMLRGEPKVALEYIDQALKIEPEYAEALADKQTALNALRQADQK
jgi:Flp pilus assembly protein TadD